MSNPTTTVATKDAKPYAGPTAGSLIALLSTLPADEPLALWVFTRSEVQDQMARKPLTNEEWQRIVEDFDGVCGSDGELFDQLYETLCDATQSGEIG
jgi:hypothetical protein